MSFTMAFTLAFTLAYMGLACLLAVVASNVMGTLTGVAATVMTALHTKSGWVKPEGLVYVCIAAEEQLANELCSWGVAGRTTMAVRYRNHL